MVTEVVRGGQGKRGREMRKLTMPWSCCQIKVAVTNASLAGVAGARAAATASTSCWKTG